MENINHVAVTAIISGLKVFSLDPLESAARETAPQTPKKNPKTPKSTPSKPQRDDPSHAFVFGCAGREKRMGMRMKSGFLPENLILTLS